MVPVVPRFVRRMLSRQAAILPALLIGLQFAAAQPFEWQVKPSFKIVHPPDPDVLNPFTGGINAPIVQFIDLNSDGDRDLYVLDFDGRVNFYENIGNAGYPAFMMRSLDIHVYEPPDFDPAPFMPGTWFRFVDVDKDGDYDLLCNGPSATVKFYRNKGTAVFPILELESAPLLTIDNTPVISESISVPAFADVDGDGDVDFFSGNSLGYIVYYENVGATPQDVKFKFTPGKYQNIEIIGFGGKKGESPATPPALSEARALHGAMAIDFADIDNDDDLDLFWGDLFNTSLYFLENVGEPTHPAFTLRDSTYPKPNVVQTSGFNMPQLVDIDDDGKLDLFVEVLFGATTNNFQYYENIGELQQPRFRPITLNYLSTIDIGAASAPVFADIDGDNDADLIIGSEDGKLVRYNRIGSGSSLRYELNTDPVFTPTGFFNLSPAFADLDGDGKLDLLLGESNGRLHLYRGSNPAGEDMTFPLRTVSFGQNASPALIDFDKNGTFDLFVGTGSGRIHFYSNDGSPTVPQFALESAFVDSIDVGDDAKPAFADFDLDGDADLVVGSRDSSLRYYRNNNGAFTRVADFFAGVASFPRVAPAMQDYDADGDPDLFLGNYKGGLLFYRNNGVFTSVESSPFPGAFQLYQNYPNPFNPATNFGFRIADMGMVKLSVYDLLGREVAVVVNQELRPGEYTVAWNASGYPSGVYYYRLSTGGFVETKKAVLVK